ncbi:uncharacterized protein BO96DRAFT_434473 [Aspergillus niger CBS 101883]|uniref:uncharacterized protein n=1 Tax=Aspergillus lacticoffeatus (strain CBS 101883) TaxID=1450533 RepID=UPI000D7ECDF3|nr:uncharacterized protein BO96DRAFT_434473 [Aspergillus niger CBS 101883]PYH56495.1 hypothetical protein BO96DRAFT_434473 [Aspergillus niger CBS 101883]
MWVMDVSDASEMDEPLVDVLRSCRMPGCAAQYLLSSDFSWEGPQIPLRYLVPMKSSGRYLDNEDTAEQSHPRPTPRLERVGRGVWMSIKSSLLILRSLRHSVSIKYLLAGRGQVGLQTGQGQCQLSAGVLGLIVACLFRSRNPIEGGSSAPKSSRLCSEGNRLTDTPRMYLKLHYHAQIG